MKRVLIITYYWPPSGGSAVLRWLKFTRYLRDFGWEPVIFTPLNPEPQESDESLLSDIPQGVEIIKRRILEPYGIYKFLTGKKQKDRLGVALMNQNDNKSLISKVSLWIRSNLFIPDPRKFWVKPSVRYLKKYILKQPVDAVISTGPPHSMHLIGMKLKKKTGIRWIADFRDPWTNIDFYTQLRLTGWADSKHRILEKAVLTQADHVITVSPGMTREFRDSGVKNISTITNGYDEEPVNTQPVSHNNFTLIHLGSMPSSRNPEVLWEAVAELIDKRTDIRDVIKIRLIGKIDADIRKSLTKYELTPYVINDAYVPHAETLNILTSASVLLLFINNTPNAGGILTNKFFEYLSAKRPILAIGPIDGDAASILRETEAGKIFRYDDTCGVKTYLSELFDLYSQNLLQVQPRSIEKYSRKYLTGKLAGLLNEITSK